MAYFAKLNSLNIVEQVVSVNDTELLDNGVESENKGVEFLRTLFNEPTAVWIQTSYNTHGGVHSEGKESFRKNYATVGGLYDVTRNAFIPKKRYDSWMLNEHTCLWEAPIPYPEDGKQYIWDEIQQTWVEITV